MRKSVSVAAGLLLVGGTIWAQQYLITTVAGGGIPPTPAAALSVGLGGPRAAAVDILGNVYFSDSNFVFKIDRSGILTRVAGNGIAGYSGDGGPATRAQLSGAWSVAADASGSVYIADAGNSRVRKVTPDGTITTVAGDGTYGYSGDGGPATRAQLESPTGVGMDAAGDVYIADSGNNSLRRMTPDGTIRTVAVGSGWGVAVDAAGNVYGAAPVANVVYKIAPDGTVIVAAGVYTAGYSGDGGPATSAQLNDPWGAAVDASGNLYMADTGNYRVRKVAVDGTITTVAGNGASGFSGDGGPATSAALDPVGVAVDSTGSLYIADSGNGRVRKVAPDGTITTVAGGAAGDSGDGGPATIARLAAPRGLTVDASGNIYFAEYGSSRIRRVAADGTITTAAGNGIGGYAGDGRPATGAQVASPRGVALDSQGNLYIADTGNQKVRKVAADGTITTVASVGSPDGVAVDAAGDLYIADTSSYAVRKMAPDGTITTLAQGSADSEGASDLVPMSVGVDTGGNVYIADDGPYWVIVRPGSYLNHVGWNARIRKLAPDGTITTVAGDGFPGYSGDGGPATQAALNFPNAVALDAAGSLYIGEGNFDSDSTGIEVPGNEYYGNEVVRKVDARGTITTVAGNGTSGYSGDGGPATGAQLNNPSGVAVDAAGNVYIGDTDNNAVRLLVPAGTRPLLSVASTHSGYFAPGQAGAAYMVVVSNAAGAGPTTGAVTVKELVSAGLTLVSVSGPGWSCSNNTCTRGDVLSPGSSYPAITATVNVAADAPSQVTNQVAVSGGAAVVLSPPQAPVLISPASGVTGILLTPVLSWGSSFGAVSYDVYFGTSSSPPLVADAAGTSFAPGMLTPDATYYWRIVAQNSSGSASSATGSFTTAGVAGLRLVQVTPCRVADTRGPVGSFGGPGLGGGLVRSFVVPQSGCGIPGAAQAYSLNVTVVPKGPLGYLTLWPTGQVQPFVSTLNSGNGDVVANAAIVPAGAGGAVSFYVTDATDVILDINGYFDSGSGANSYSFYAATPCRVADTRNATGEFGGPSMGADQTRDFPIPSSVCQIPSSSQAYSLNVTVVPDPAVGFLGYLSTWPTGQAQPRVSTLNSWTGKVVANAAIVPAGTNGSISVFVTDPTDVILDTNGYFAAPGNAGALTFYPVTPCRVADTRGASGPFGGPTMGAGTTRSFTIPASGCSVPATAAAYSLNVTVVPDGVLSYLTTWPTGSTQPFVSTLNSFDGSVVANAAIVPAGAGGAINVFVTNQTDVILDINGYFAP